MATSSGWGARPINPQNRDLICPICLDQLTIPRSLPCLHTFCTKCLRSHITNTVKKVSGINTLHCPVCSTVIHRTFGDTPLTAWAEQFSVDVVLASLLPGDESIVGRKCEPCSIQGKQLNAKYFCLVCKESRCQTCYKHHETSKLLKDHQIITLEEFLSDPAKAATIADTPTCTDHENKEFVFFCSDHDKVLCATCLVEGHSECTNYSEITIHAKDVLKTQRTRKALNKMKELENHLIKVSKMKNQNIIDFDVHIKRHLNEISILRQKINFIFDELENRVNEEGEKIIKEQSTRKLHANIQIQSLVAAIKNSCKQLEAISKYGPETQTCIFLHKMEEQLLAYETKTVDYSEILKYDIHLNIPDCIHEVSMIPLTDICCCKVLKTRQTIPLPYDITQSHVSIKANMGIIKIREIKVDRPTNGKPLECTGIACLSDGKTVFLDMANSRCCLYDSCYKYITEYKLSSEPRRICSVGNNEIAVSLPEEMKIHIFLIGDAITLTRSVVTPRWCTAIATLNNKELICTGWQNGRYHWGVITINGQEKSYFFFPQTRTKPGGTSVIFNSLKTRVCISCHRNNAVYCFGLDGIKHFEYRSENLIKPAGMATDMEDNLLIAGCYSHNIHQLSQDGSVLQVISSGIPKYPFALCLKNSGERFLLISDSGNDKCFVYQVK